MQVPYVSIKAAVTDYIDFANPEEEINETLLLKLANDAASLICSDDQTDHKVALLEVRNNQATLPDDFRKVVQAAYRDAPGRPHLKEEIVQWTQHALDDSGCSVDITLNCKDCFETQSEDCDKCSQSSTKPFIIVDVDRAYENTHPELYTKYMSHFYTYRNLNERGGCVYHPEFRLMGARTNNFGNLDYHIQGCLNLNLDCEIEYDINLPSITVNFPKGQILLSYMGLKTDEEGYRLLPNTPRAFRAINWYIEERMNYRAYKKTGDPKYYRLWTDSVREMEKAIARARIELDMPEYDTFMRYIKSHWKRIIPYHNHEANLNRFQRDTFRQPKF